MFRVFLLDVARLAKKVFTSKYFWVFVVAYALGMSRGTVKLEQVEVEKRVEVPVERVVYQNTSDWRKLDEVDGKIFAAAGTHANACNVALKATGEFFSDFDSEKLLTVINKQSDVMSKNNVELANLRADREEVVRQLEQGK